MARGIYKRGTIYWIRYRIHGELKRESSESSKVRDAEALLIKRKQEAAEGKSTVSLRISNHNFKNLVDEYIQWAAFQKSFRSKIGCIRQLSEAFGILPLKNFTSKLIEKYQMQRREKGNKSATVNRHIATLKHMFTKAVEWDMAEEDTLRRVRKVKLFKENNRRLRYLDEEECHKLIDACEAHLKPIIVTAVNTGMRKTEILSLKWSNIDLKNGFILLDDSKNGERREIPINSTLRETLTSPNVIRRLDVPFVFYAPVTGKPYKEVKKSFATACKRADITDFRFHDLRHTFASHMVMSGADLRTLQELLGHKTLTMTLRYSHLSPSHKIQAVEILGKRLSIKKSAQKVHNL